MGAAQESAPQIQLRGRLWKRFCYVPADQKPGEEKEGGSVDDTDCLLFDLCDGQHLGRDTTYALELGRADWGPEEEEGEEEAWPSEQAVLMDVRMEVPAEVRSWEEEWEIVQLPARHLLLSRGTIGEPVMRRSIQRRVVTLGLPWGDAVAHLPTLLAELPPSSPLRRIALQIDSTDLLNETEADLLVGALESSSRIDGVRIQGDFSTELPAFFDSLLRRLLQSMTHVAILLPRPSWWNKSVPDMLRRETVKLKQLQCSSWILDALTPCSSLMRLDIRIDFSYAYQWDKLMTLCASLKSLTDLGIEIQDLKQMAALKDHKLHLRILTLRLHIHNTSIQGVELMVMQCLKDTGCTIQFLSWNGAFAWNKGGIFQIFDSSQCPELPVPLSALRVSIYNTSFTGEVHDLAEYLSSPAAHKLVYFDIRQPMDLDSASRADVEWELANSLNNNFVLCNLGLVWKNSAAETHAISIIRRNKLYRDAKLLVEDQVKPGLAKLFVCGHPEVGKTTLSQALLSQQKDFQWPISSVFGECYQNLKPSPDYTRGMQMHPLKFKGQDMKLMLCDLAGPEEFHVFHNFFFNASKNDMFVVICKKEDDSTFEDFQQQLCYWLRFIVSHRSSRKNLSTTGLNVNHKNFKPKVVVVVNFFQQEKCEDSFRNITKEWTSSIMEMFSELLDFDYDLLHQEYNNLFGLNARTRGGVPQLHGRLKSLLEDISRCSSLIPKLCNDISACLTREKGRQNLLRSVFSAASTGKPRLLTTFAAVCKALSKNQINEPASKVQAALEELHAQGYVIYCPYKETYENHGKSSCMKRESAGKVASACNTPVIVDINWFLNKLVGSLLDKHMGAVRTRPSKWSIADLKELLRIQGCNEDELEGVLGYLLNLELCVSLNNAAVGDEERLLLFPALAKNKTISFSEAWTASGTKFFGRRIKCRDVSVHLIPFSVFARLQVKLHNVYSRNNRSLRLGFGWVSFLSGRVGVVVKFGGDVMDEVWEKKQWVDILTFCPEDRHLEGALGYRSRPLDDPRSVEANRVLNTIRDHFYAACKGGVLGGIPTVGMEEMVLQNHKADSDAVSLASVLETARTEGLHEAHQSWRSFESTPVLNLLLPDEMMDFVAGRPGFPPAIKEEFGVIGSTKGEASRNEELQPESNLADPFEVLGRKMQAYCADLKSEMRINFKAMQRNMETMWADMGRVERVLKEAQRDIADAHRSTRAS